MADIGRIANGGASDLFDRVAAMIEQTGTSVASQASAALTMMNRQIGHLIDAEVLGEQRAGYAKEIEASVGQPLTGRPQERVARRVLGPGRDNEDHE